MRFHYFADNREPETGTFFLFTSSAPEPFENVLPIGRWNTLSAISNIDTAIWANLHNHFGADWRMHDSILDKVPQSILKRVSVRLDFGRLPTSHKNNLFLLSNRPWSHRCDDGGRDFIEINDT